MLLEIRANNKMRNESIGTSNTTSQYEPLSEERRRIKNYKKSVILSIIGLLIFVIVLGVGNDKINGRSCSFGRSLDRGVCVDCTDQYCLQCNSGKD